MLSERQVSGSIDSVYRQALQEAGSIDSEIASLTERYVKLREEEAAAYLSLARLRLNDLADDVVVHDLSAAEQQAHMLLRQREDSVKLLDTDLAGIETELARLNQEREAASKDLEEKSKALAAAEDAVLSELSNTEAYEVQRVKADEAEKVAHHAEQKAQFAEQDRLEKGKPYEDDPLFMYLWRAGFGTPKYKGGFIARILDRWVARLIEFDRARANCAMLVQIPKRLQAHAERQRALADEEADRLEDMARAALRSAEPTACRERLTDAQARLGDLDARIEAAEARRATMFEKRAALNSGADEQTTEALDVIVAALKRDDLRQLKQQAMRTPLPEDDTVVDRIEDIETEIQDVKDAVDERKALQAEQRKRMAELERVRREHRQNGGGDDAWDFQDTRMLTMMLAQVLGGALSGDRVRDQMSRRRVPRNRGSFGGGGFPMPRFPGGHGGGRPRMPRGGSGGGGFRTGGGF